MIPRRLIRCIPETTSDEVEAWWSQSCVLCDGWEHVTWRDPINPVAFPLTAADWRLCTSGAQLAGLVRLEALWHDGGVYIDSDVELYRPLDELLDLEAFAAWEDDKVIPDAVIGAADHHPAIGECIDMALERLRSGGWEWQTGCGAWSTGPGVTTEVFGRRDDVTVLAPASFYPYHYTEPERRLEDHRGPGTFGAHHWAATWLS